MLKEDIVIGKKYRWHEGFAPVDDEYPDEPNLTDGEIVEVVGISKRPGRKFPIYVWPASKRDSKLSQIVAPQELSELD